MGLCVCENTLTKEGNTHEDYRLKTKHYMQLLEKLKHCAFQIIITIFLLLNTICLMLHQLLCQGIGKSYVLLSFFECHHFLALLCSGCQIIWLSNSTIHPISHNLKKQQLFKQQWPPPPKCKSFPSCSSTF